MFKSVLIAIALTLPAAAWAQAVNDCATWQSSARNIAEPWEQNTRTFANGDVRVAMLDTVEPASGAFFLLVLTPPWDEVGSRVCGVVAEDGGEQGFAGMDLGRLGAGYDPAAGLVLTVPVQRFAADTGDFRDATLTVTINQATGSILADAR